MARFRNDHGYRLHINDLSRVVEPGEEFTWRGYDPEVHGAVTGCTRLDEPPAKARTGGGEPPATPATPPRAARGKSKAAGAAGEE